jgi:transposase
MDNSTKYIGVDVSSEHLVCACPEASHPKYTVRVFDNKESDIRTFVLTLDPNTDHVILEATGTYSMRLVWILHQNNIRVSVLSPHQSTGFIKYVMNDSIKNDERDACALSYYGQRMEPPCYQPKPEAIQRSEQLQRLYSQLIEDRGAVANRLHALSFHPLPEPTVLSVQEGLLTFYDQKIAEVKGQITDMDNDEFNQMIKLIASIAGIGSITASAIVVVTNGLATFQNDGQLAKFIGVNPSQDDSGKHKGRGKIPKRGNRRLRALLYVCAISAKRHNPKCKELYERIRAKGKCHKVAMIAVVRKLIAYIFAVAKNKTLFQKDYCPKPENA